MSFPEPRSDLAQHHAGAPAAAGNLADILERVLDKGIVIAGDIRINLLEIELLTVKLRLLIASVDKAREMGIDWWEHDPSLSSAAENHPALEERLGRIEEALGLPASEQGAPEPQAGARTRGRVRER